MAESSNSQAAPCNTESDTNDSKKSSEDDPEVLPHMLDELEEELERELEMKAQRNNLTAWNVKKMIKAVIMDSEVMKMVDYSLHKTVEKPVYELKLTRAKSKQLKALDQNAIWSPRAFPSKKSDIEVLITQDLPEDSSDEEYQPQDEGSDEESKATGNILYDSITEDGDTTLDEIECVLENEKENTGVSEEMISSEAKTYSDENIGQRTRSKLSLSETPLEAIEQAFIPPDITTDMYNTECDNVDWLNFLKEFMQPLDSSQQEVVDDDNDPEYNVMIDEEQEATDNEELRADRAVKITKKELNDLMAELDEYNEMLSSDDEDGDKEDKDDQHELHMGQKEETEIPANETLGQFSDTQFLLLKQQLQQHVQLLTQTCLLLCGNPMVYEHEAQASQSLQRLEEIVNFRQMGDSSFFNVLNLDSSLKLIRDWSNIILNPKNTEHIQKFMIKEINKVSRFKAKKVRYCPKLPEELMKLCLNSDAFLYPLLLPPGGFSDFTASGPVKFTNSEIQLLVMGLEQFSQFFGCDLEKREDIVEVVGYIQEYLLPVKSVDKIMSQIRKLLNGPNPNPVKMFFETKKSPDLQHYVVDHTTLKSLRDYPPECLPENWAICF